MLLNKNIVVNNRRTSIRLQKEMWWALDKICLKEKASLNQICSKIDDIRGKMQLSAAVRFFILAYFRKKLSEYEKELVVFPKKNCFNDDFEDIF